MPDRSMGLRTQGNYPAGAQPNFGRHGAIHHDWRAGSPGSKACFPWLLAQGYPFRPTGRNPGVSTFVPISKGIEALRKLRALFAAGGRSEQGPPLGLPLMRFARRRKYFSPYVSPHGARPTSSGPTRQPKRTVWKNLVRCFV